MSNDKREHPNMTATDIANAKHPPAPGHGILADLVEREARLLGIVPVGSVVIRKATVADWRVDASRALLVQHPDGSQHWLPEGLTSSSEISR